MKKLFLILTFAFGSLLPRMAEAQQSQYYYLTGDTIVGRSPIYFYQWWSEAWLTDTNHKLALYWIRLIPDFYLLVCLSASCCNTAIQRPLSIL